MAESLQAISETFSKSTEKTEYDEEFTQLEKVSVLVYEHTFTSTHRVNARLWRP